MARKQDLIIGAFIFLSVLFLFVILLVMFSLSTRERGFISPGGKKIGVVELRGVIYDSRTITRQFQRLRKDRSIKAIILRIDSPGGMVAAAQEIYQAVQKTRDSGKPVVVSMGDVAASGGYYVACGADTIVANPGTTTGSIGVILEIPNVKDLFQKLGIGFHIIKSGKYKDTGSPYRDMTPEERQYLQNFVNDAYQQFVDVVAKERKMDRKKVLEIADGRVFTGQQALELGLVDVLGDFEDAVQIAQRMAGIKGEPVLIRFPKRRFTIWDLLFSDIRKWLRPLEATPLLKYQWCP